MSPLPSYQAYEDFELSVGSKTNDGYPVSITHAPAGDASGMCRLDPATPEFQADLLRLENEDADEAFLTHFGHHLFDVLFTDEIASVYRGSLGHVRGQGKGLRVRLRMESPELSALPWEYLYDSQEDYFLAISSEMALVRYVPTRGTVRSTSVTFPLRVLVVISNPHGVPPLNMEQEQDIIEAALRQRVSQGVIQLRILKRGVVAEISQAIRDFHPHVLHFIGHGQFEDEEAYVLLEDDWGDPLPMDERAFREFFLGVPEARLAVLNACQTATTSSTRPLTGLAPRILQRSLSAVVAMQYPMPDTAALIFSREFYRSLASGYPVDAAMGEARKGIFLEVGRDEPSWGIPVLFSRAHDGRLFEIDDASGSRPAQGERSAELTAFPQSENNQDRSAERFRVGDIQAGIVNMGGEQTFTGDLSLSLDFSQTTNQAASGGTFVTGDQYLMSGDFRGSVLYIKSQLEGVTQSVSAWPHVAGAEKEELIRLVNELRGQLEQVPPDKVGQAEKVSDRVEALVGEVGDDDPDREMVEITGESLKRAAQNLAEVLPAVLTIAAQIVAHAIKLVG